MGVLGKPHPEQDQIGGAPPGQELLHSDPPGSVACACRQRHAQRNDRCPLLLRGGTESGLPISSRYALFHVFSFVISPKNDDEEGIHVSWWNSMDSKHTFSCCRAMQSLFGLACRRN